MDSPVAYSVNHSLGRRNETVHSPMEHVFLAASLDGRGCSVTKTVRRGPMEMAVSRPVWGTVWETRCVARLMGPAPRVVLQAGKMSTPVTSDVKTIPMAWIAVRSAVLAVLMVVVMSGTELVCMGVWMATMETSALDVQKGPMGESVLLIVDCFVLMGPVTPLLESVSSSSVLRGGAAQNVTLIHV